MSLASLNPDDEFPVTPQPAQVQPDNYKGLVYDDRVTPLVSLSAFVEGSPWSVTYFSQQLGAHNDLKTLDTQLDAAYQSYQRINGLELRMTQELQDSTDTTGQETTVTGVSLVMPFIRPNAGDMFLANTGYNKTALMRVTTVDRQKFRRDSVHQITYKLVDYIDRIPDQIADLEKKTTSIVFFSRERLMEGLAPFLKTEDYQMVSDLKQDYERIANYYLETFFDRASRTLTIPGQPDTRIYDHHLMQYVMATIPFSEFFQMLDFRQLPTDNDPYIDQPQFWKALLNQDYKTLQWCNQKMGLASTGQFDRNPWIKGLYFARIEHVVYPRNPDVSTNGAEATCVAEISTTAVIKPTTNRQNVSLTPTEKLYSMANQTVPSYPMVLVDDYYVFTQAFYENGAGLSLLEIMVRDYLNGAPVPLKYVQHMSQLYPKMERLEQFYFGPILLTLIRYADRRAYST